MALRSGNTSFRVRTSASRTIPDGHERATRAWRGAAAAFVLVACISGCAQHASVICDPLEKASRGDFAAAVASLDETTLAGSDRDRFLYHAQRGHLLHLAGDYEASNAEFERAVRIGEDLEPTSVTATLADFTLNEAVKAYAGEDYERAYLHYYMALNYLALDDPESALVECRRLDRAFRKLDARYDDDDRYQDDGFIRYLSGLIYESTGRINNAFVDYKAAARAYISRTHGTDALPDGLAESLREAGARLGLGNQVDTLLDAEADTTAQAAPALSEPSGAVITVVVDAGWAPYKREESIEVPIYRPLVPDDFKGEDWLSALIKIAYPEYVSVPLALDRIEVRAEPIGPGKTGSAKAEMVRDLDALARATLERRLGALKLRSTMRATAKQIVLMKQKADHAKDGSRSLGSRILRGILERTATVLTAESEQADTRSWVTLPREIWLARVPVPPGLYRVTVVADIGPPVLVDTVRVERGDTVFRPIRVFGGAHPVHCETD
jgi:hypothetical protein